MRTPTRPDLRAALAAGSDTMAQRWLGWRAEEIIPEDERTTLLEQTLDAAPAGYRPIRRATQMIAIDRKTNRVVGAGTVDNGLHGPEIGGWLAPSHRGEGLGVELFTGILEFGHRHLGHKKLRAGTEFANLPSRATLAAVGFVPAWGMSRHVLPDSRMVDSVWFEHVAAESVRCRA